MALLLLANSGKKPFVDAPLSANLLIRPESPWRRREMALPYISSSFIRLK